MSDSSPIIGVLALLAILLGVLVIVPAGPGQLTILTNEDYDEKWEEYEVTDPTIDFSVGFGLLVLNLSIMIGFLTYSLVTYRDPEEEDDPWDDPPELEDEE